MEAGEDKSIGRPIIGHTILSYTRAGMHYWASNKPRKRPMIGLSEAYARTLMKERLMWTECKGEQREWCRIEYRTGRRDG